MSASDASPTLEVAAAYEPAMQQLATVAGLASVPKDRDEFWYQIALAAGVSSPSHDAVAALRQILDAFDEAWDDDYCADDGVTPSLEAFETVFARFPQTSDSAIGPQAVDIEEEDEDDSLGALPSTFTSEAQKSDPDIETVLQRIRERRWRLNPDWQRGFVWKLQKQRRLVESILLGLPIPSMLLFRDTDGVTYVIDGRQRLETLSRFTAGKPAKGEERRRFKTFPAKEPGWGEGERLHSAAGKYYDDLPKEFKTAFDSTPLVVHTFTSLPKQKLYQIFKRYNTGAEQLRPAEIRNAVYQASPIHKMMYRLGGEQATPNLPISPEETRATDRLRFIMKKKVARYGAYDFVGRYFAFAYMNVGTVANATNEFMDKFEGEDPDKLRKEFVTVLNTTCDWYEYPLTAPEEGAPFHAFLATVQMISTRAIAAEFVDSGEIPVATIKEIISIEWPRFAALILEDKQNAKIFWGRQREWIDLLRDRCRSVVGNA
jgi:hypothetical protein